MRMEKSPAKGKKLEDIQVHIFHLDNLCLGLRLFRARYGKKPRAIPRLVVAELLDAVQPGSMKNPFAEAKTQWRVYALVNLLLFQGLRISEALTLKADFVKAEQIRAKILGRVLLSLQPRV